MNRRAELQKYIGPVNYDINGADYEIDSHRNLNPENPIHTFEACRQLYLDEIRRNEDKGVVLLHDWSADTGKKGDELRSKNRTLELTKSLVPNLLHNGFRFVALNEIEIAP